MHALARLTAAHRRLSLGTSNKTEEKQELSLAYNP